MDLLVGKFVEQLEVVHACITVPPVVPYPWPINLVLLGKTHVLGMTMVPAGSRIVDAALLLLQGLAEHTIGVAEMMPLASTTIPETKVVPLRMLCKVAQMSALWETLLASMNAGEGISCLDELYTALLPAWPTAAVGQAKNEASRTNRIPKNIEAGTNLIVTVIEVPSS